MDFKGRYLVLIIALVLTLTSTFPLGAGYVQAVGDTQAKLRQGENGYRNAFDTRIKSSSPDESYSDSAALRLSGWLPTNSAVSYSLIKFNNINAIVLTAATVATAYIDLYVSVVSQATSDIVDVYEMKVSDLNIKYATWHKKSMSLPWNNGTNDGPVAGIDYDSNPIASTTISHRSLEGIYKYLFLRVLYKNG